MSDSWRPDEVRGLIQEFDSRLLYRPCRNCGESTSPLKMGEDGWCDSCTDPKPVVVGPCGCGCLKPASPSAYVDYWTPRSDEK